MKKQSISERLLETIYSYGPMNFEQVTLFSRCVIASAQRNLNKMLDDGLITKERQGKEVIYSITEKGKGALGDRVTDKELKEMFYSLLVPRYPKYLVYHWSLEKCWMDDWYKSNPDKIAA